MYRVRSGRAALSKALPFFSTEECLRCLAHVDTFQVVVGLLSGRTGLPSSPLLVLRYSRQISICFLRHATVRVLSSLRSSSKRVRKHGLSEDTLPPQDAHAE
eukprot:scaffold77217_cov34-Attheya_sp.AAC.4